MAIYHLSMKVFTRGKGDSAIDKAAYRAGEKLLSDYNGLTYDYTRKFGVIHTEILLPDHAPREYFDRTILWNAVERAEKSGNSQLARELEISLPIELSIEQNISLAFEYVKRNFVSQGMCADVCFHDKNDGNPHFHVLLTMRPIEQDGRWGAKSKKEYILDENGERIRLPKSGEYKSRKINAVDWSEQSKAEEWREAWANICNEYLERHGHSSRIDHRSYERQGIDKVPQIHMGAAACSMEKKGIVTEKGNINREIAKVNREIDDLRKEL
ncbi:MAG: MobA/MobL family protein, partial [Oscillospiraceae bacterium]|nr:MobA/MobL family protein [Oscillospiraceae bacterium]MCL2578389.1 MobA/MobL family protein [Defluviitaleaceae bacterium]